VVQFQGACVAEGCTMLVTEFMEVGSLQQLLVVFSNDQNVFHQPPARMYSISRLFMRHPFIRDGRLPTASCCNHAHLLQGGDLWRIMARDKDRAVFGWYRRCVVLILTACLMQHVLRVLPRASHAAAVAPVRLAVVISRWAAGGQPAVQRSVLT
jgi:hypothetical protein